MSSLTSARALPGIFTLLGALALTGCAQPNRIAIQEPPLRGGSTCFGRIVIATGDCDGDGLRDYAASMPFVDEGRGLVRIFSSKSHAALFDLRPTAPSPYTWLGHVMVSLPDVDGDGIEDLAVSRYDDTGTEVFSLGTRRGLFSIRGYPRSLREATGPRPDRILVARDLDGDGGTDLLVCGTTLKAYSGSNGAAIAEPLPDGVVALVPAPKSSLAGVSRSNGVVFRGEGEIEFYDCAVTLDAPSERLKVKAPELLSAPGSGLHRADGLHASDLDGDGRLDLIELRSSDGVPGGNERWFRLRVFGSRTGDLTFQRIWRSDSEPPECLANCVGLPGDLNSDGTPDLIVGVPFAWAIPGGVFAISGRDGSDIWRAPPPQEAGAPDGTLLEMGMTLGVIDDVDGDRVAEVVVACGDYHWGAGTEQVGMLLVLSGRTGVELLRKLETEEPRHLLPP